MSVFYAADCSRLQLHFGRYRQFPISALTKAGPLRNLQTAVSILNETSSTETKNCPLNFIPFNTLCSLRINCSKIIELVLTSSSSSGCGHLPGRQVHLSAEKIWRHQPLQLGYEQGAAGGQEYAPCFGLYKEMYFNFVSKTPEFFTSIFTSIH